jgi:hypothetical protein
VWGEKEILEKKILINNALKYINLKNIRKRDDLDDVAGKWPTYQLYLTSDGAKWSLSGTRRDICLCLTTPSDIDQTSITRVIAELFL